VLLGENPQRLPFETPRSNKSSWTTPSPASSE